MFFSGVTSNVRKKHPFQPELFSASMAYHVSAQDSFCFVFSCYMIMNFNSLIAALKDGLHWSDITNTIFLQSLKTWSTCLALGEIPASKVLLSKWEYTIKIIKSNDKQVNNYLPDMIPMLLFITDISCNCESFSKPFFIPWWLINSIDPQLFVIIIRILMLTKEQMCSE